MRDSWTETTLGNLINLRTGKLDVNAGVENGEFPFFTCSRETYKIDVAEYSGKSVIVAGNGDLNVKYFEGEFNAYQRTYILQAIDEEKLNPLYLFHFMDKYVETLRNDTQGSTIQYLKKAQFTEAPIDLPPLDEQKRIVDVMSSVDAYIDALQQQADTVRTARNAVLYELLSAGGDDWTETTLGDVAEVLDRMRKPVSGAEREKRQGQVPYYGATGQAGWIDAPIFDEELVLLGEDAIDFLNPLVHKAYLISGPSWVNNHAHVLRARRERVLAYFLMEALNAVDYSRFVAFGTRSKLTQSAMMDITINLPPLAEQKRIVDVVSSMDEVIQSTEQAVVDAKNLRSGLLSDLLSGEHEIPASYDVFVGAA